MSMPPQDTSSQQTINTLKHAAYWGLGAAALVAIAPAALPVAAAGGIATALGLSLPMAGAVLGGIIGYNKPTS